MILQEYLDTFEVSFSKNIQKFLIKNIILGRMILLENSKKYQWYLEWYASIIFGHTETTIPKIYMYVKMFILKKIVWIIVHTIEFKTRVLVFKFFWDASKVSSHMLIHTKMIHTKEGWLYKI